MNRIKNCYQTLLFAFFILGFMGCKSTKEVVRKSNDNDLKRLDHLVYENGNFATLNSKVEFKFIPREGVSAGMRGTIKMRRDSCLILSIQPFIGIEAVRCLIRKDSIFIVSRLHQTYATESISQWKNAQYLNLELLQAILSNRVFVPGVSKPTEKELKMFEWHKQKDGDYFRLPDQNYILDFCLNPDGEFSELKASSPERQEKINVTYDFFQKGDEGKMPTKLLFATESPKQSFKLQITYLKPSFDSPTDFGFDIPSKYKKVTTEELIKRFQTML